ncbi:SPFH domain-containing protein [Promicromonospora sp. CA-289599]|uniref:SPFH domain-containing protein n=1 Tax=Promicromonospora sp. CA-289599 TaxID=3240014 RepID=UPI003D902AA8
MGTERVVVVRGPFEPKRPRHVVEDARPGSHEQVVFHRGGISSVLQPGELPTSGMSWFSRQGHGTYRIVDMSSHPLLIEAPLASSDKGLAFACEVSAKWRVNDPLGAVEHAQTDVRQLVERAVLQTLRRTSRRYQMEDAPELEQAFLQSDLGALASADLEFVEVRSVDVKVDFDPAWEGEHRTRKLKEQVHRTAKADREAAGDVLNDEDGVTREAIARDPSYATKLADDLRKRRDEDRVWGHDRESALLQARFALLKAKVQSPDTEEWEVAPLLEAMDALLIEAGSRTRESEPQAIASPSTHAITDEDRDGDADGDPGGAHASPGGDAPDRQD